MRERDQIRSEIEENRRKQEHLQASRKKFFDAESLVDDELDALKQSISMMKNDKSYADAEIAMVLDEQEELIGKLFRERKSYLDVIDREYDNQISNLNFDIEELEKKAEEIEREIRDEDNTKEGEDE